MVVVVVVVISSIVIITTATNHVPSDNPFWCNCTKENPNESHSISRELLSENATIQCQGDENYIEVHDYSQLFSLCYFPNPVPESQAGDESLGMATLAMLLAVSTLGILAAVASLLLKDVKGQGHLGLQAGDLGVTGRVPSDMVDLVKMEEEECESPGKKRSRKVVRFEE